jgi:hypothetical protein
MGLDFRERNVRLRQKADIVAFKRPGPTPSDCHFKGSGRERPEGLG